MVLSDEDGLTWNATAVLAYLLLLFLLACGEETPIPDLSPQISSDGSEIHYPVSLSEYVDDAQPEILSASPYFQVDKDTFGYIADVAVSASGHTAVLDRMEKKVVVFGPDGVEERRLGRSGRGPGEFLDPWAVTWVGEALVVWQAAPPFLTVFRQDGTVSSGPPLGFAGDWQAHPFRQPTLRVDFPYQMGEEDITLRLGGFGSERFGLVLQDNERLTEVNTSDPPAYLTIWDLNLSQTDTVDSFSGPPMTLDQVGENVFSYTSPIYTPRPYWASGDGWYGVHERGSTEVKVSDLQGAMILRITWPDTAHDLVWQDRMERVDWMEVDRDKEIPKEAKERYASEWLTYSEVVPEVMGLFGAGRCLWISSFSSADYSTGAGLTLLMVHLDAKWPPRVVRIPRKGSRLRAVSQRGIITTYEDDMDIQILEFYPVPSLDCNG
jgi:hypothetical protein